MDLRYTNLVKIVLRLSGVRKVLEAVADEVGPSEVYAAAARLVVQDEPWDEDWSEKVPRRTDIPRWPNGRWAHRDLSIVDKVTVHHIASWADPIAHSRNYLRKGAGRPAPPYTIWIDRDRTLKLLNLNEACWHDHSGRTSRNLSVGLNGALHREKPTQYQMQSLVRVCAWAIAHPEMRVPRDGIRGHMYWIGTECPGWRVGPVGNRRDFWKDEFFQQLKEVL